MLGILQRASRGTYKNEERGKSIELDNCEGENLELQLQIAETDKSDAVDESKRVTCWSLVFPILGIIFHIGDVGSDVYLAIKYLWENQILYFFCTITVVFIPTIVNMLISFRMFEQKKINYPTSTTVSWKKKGWSSALVHLFHLAPIFYNSNSFRYAWKSINYENKNRSKQQRYYRKMHDENEEFAILKIFDAFFEAAPQLILQLTILLIDNVFPSWIKIVSICTSFISMGLTLAGYHRSIRLAQDDKNEMGIIGTILQFLWHFCIIVSRIMSISIVASKWPIPTVVCCSAHWVVMFIWLIVKPYGITIFCANKNHQSSPPLTPKEQFRCALFAAALGVVYIFTYLKPSEHNTSKRYLVYYIICGVENAIAILLWILFSDELVQSYWYFKPLIGLCIVLFPLGIGFMVFYYKFFHPTLSRQTSTPELVPPLFDCCSAGLLFLSFFVLCHST